VRFVTESPRRFRGRPCTPLGIIRASNPTFGDLRFNAKTTLWWAKTRGTLFKWHWKNVTAWLQRLSKRVLTIACIWSYRSRAPLSESTNWSPSSQALSGRIESSYAPRRKAVAVPLTALELWGLEVQHSCSMNARPRTATARKKWAARCVSTAAQNALAVCRTNSFKKRELLLNRVLGQH